MAQWWKKRRKNGLKWWQIKKKKSWIEKFERERTCAKHFVNSVTIMCDKGSCCWEEYNVIFNISNTEQKKIWGLLKEAYTKQMNDWGNALCAIMCVLVSCLGE